ncbi:TatD family hydrolase [Carboxylicivirga marina]|uniref:TatD family hydrolase n=1 Tax=Carboxylicivirga marina TaxID=2800988 RepID=UPI0025968D1A|nr:TatD family hydrolase [uncultured Carboxylicivirga sp.]
MIDTHSHIYLSDFDEDRSEVINRAKALGLEKILLPNVDEETFDAMHQLEEQNDGFCYAMMGIHPTSIKSNYQELLAQAKQHINERPYIAIGEIGIDLYWDKTFRAEQMKAFEEQILWAKELNLPIVIHCRDAFPEVFEVLEKQLDDKLMGVFHSFTGDEEQAKRILSYNAFMIGINGVVTFKNTHLREVVKEIPLNKLVLETDAPYLAPVPKRGRRNEPAYIERVAETIAMVHNVGIDEVKQQTTINAKSLFAL